MLVASPLLGVLTWVRDRNDAVAKGTSAYRRGDAERAAEWFSAALEGRGQKAPDPNLLLNLAHAQAWTGQVAAAQATYARLLAGAPNRVGSVARQQLAVLAAGRGETAQALALLKQALLLDPKNAGARFDYEVLSDYLARHPRTPRIPPAPERSTPKKPEKPDEQKGNEPQKPAEKAGTDRPGEVNTPQAGPPPPNATPQPRPDAAGQPDKRQPGTGPGTTGGGQAPGSGTPSPVASGGAPGSQRGLDTDAPTGGNPTASPGKQAGAAAAAPTDLRLQTQRERLEAMNLSPAQARQLLETMRAQEQQYLQQLTPAAKRKPDPSKPTW